MFLFHTRNGRGANSSNKKMKSRKMSFPLALSLELLHVHVTVLHNPFRNVGTNIACSLKQYKVSFAPN